MSQSPSSAGPGGPASDRDDDAYLATPAGRLPLHDSSAPTEALPGGYPASRAPGHEGGGRQEPDAIRAYIPGAQAAGEQAPGRQIPGAPASAAPESSTPYGAGSPVGWSAQGATAPGAASAGVPAPGPPVQPPYAAGPYPPAQFAPAQFAQAQPAPGAAVPGQYVPMAPPPGRRRTGLVIAVVLAIALVLAGGGVIGYLLWWKDDSAPSTAADPLAPDPAWAEGGHELWHATYSDADDAIPAGASFLTVKRKSSGATITSYPITDSEPTMAWQADVKKYTSYSGGVWGKHFLSGQQLVDLETGEVSDIPWDSAMDIIGVVDGVIIVCSSSTCAGYTEDLTQKWTGARFSKSLESPLRSDLVLSGSPSFITPDGHTIINVESGQTHETETSKPLNSMADGWAAYDNTGDKTVLYSPTGQEEGSVSANDLRATADTKMFASTTGQMQPSTDQIRRWANNGDMSWAVATTDSEHKGYACPTVTLTESGSTFELATDGECVTDDVYAVGANGSAAFGLVGSPDRGFQIAGVWNTSTGQEVSMPGSPRRTPYYFVSPDRLISVERHSNKVTVHAAGAA